MTDAVHIVEVGPRDGLQNEKAQIPTDKKIEFITGLEHAGLSHIEITACVHPKAVPQLSDAEDVLKWWTSSKRHANGYVLVPNVKGYERLRPFSKLTAAVVVGVSSTFNQKNINMTTEEAVDAAEDVLEACREDHRSARVYISTSFGCPYEGAVSLSQFMNVFERFLDMGVTNFSIGDTIGIASPRQVREWVRAVRSHAPKLEHVALHMHDTYGRGLVNCFAGFEEGIRWFDSSSGGLGGCPYAQGASGNTATEDLVDFFRAQGIACAADIRASELSRAVDTLVPLIGHAPPGNLFQQWYKKNHGGSRG
jgi:hydroxymethylglutaryl-CoA lyase